MRRLLILLLCLQVSSLLYAQRVYKTASGQKFILLDSGGWEYYLDQTTTEINSENQIDSIGLEEPLKEADSPPHDPFYILKQKAVEIEVEAFISLNNKYNEIAASLLLLRQLKSTDDQIAILDTEEKIKKLQALEKQALINYGRSTQIVNRVNLISSLKGKKQLKEIEELKKILNVKSIDYVQAQKTKSPEDFQADEIAFTTKSEELIITETKPAKLKATKKVVSIDCNIIEDRIDVSNNKRYVELDKGDFFSYTPPKLKSYLKNKDYLSSKAALVKNGKNYGLVLDIIHYSKDAAKSYGRIEKGNLVMIELINGKSLRLQAAFEANSRIESYTGYTIYTLYVELDKSTVNDLQKIPTDKLGIMWSTGFEAYEIYKVDYLMNQLNCLKDL